MRYLKSISWGCILVWFSPMALPAQSEKPDAGKPHISPVWVADQGDGTYKNPVLYADYSDPDVIRVGENYYLTASSFNCTPGLPILHSKDLVNWAIIGHALKKQYPAEHYALPRHGDGCWAPCLRYRKGTFYIYWGDPDFGIYMVQTNSPAGEWSQPILVLEGKGLIDPSPLWDDDGSAWLVHGWAGSRAGVNSLLTVHRLSPDGTKVLDEGKHVFDGHDAHPTVEGPKLYKRNGYYYILAPAGGVATGWQLALRSKDIYGPYEEKIVLEQGFSVINGPHQGAWIETPGGESWFMHFQDLEAYGRVVHLQPMRWEADWPVIGVDQDQNAIGEPVLTYSKPNTGSTAPVCTPVESDEFDSDTLGFQWQWHANPQVTWSAQMRGTGYLRLFPHALPAQSPNLWQMPNLLLQKFPAPDFTATTKVTWNVDSTSRTGKRAGLLVMGNDYACLALSRDEAGYKIQMIVCKAAPKGNVETVIAEQRIPANTAYLKVQVNAPDTRCRFSFSTDGSNFTPIGADFQAKPDTWIGAKVGLFCSSIHPARRGGYADFDWFRIGKIADFVRDTSYSLRSAYEHIRKYHPTVREVRPELPAGVQEQSNIVYARIGGRALHLDVFYPAEKRREGRPGVLLIHGGGWRSGNKEMEVPMAQQLAGKGFVAVVVEYRLSREAQYPAGIHDLKAAVRWMRAHAARFGLDTTRIAAYGCSSGAQMASFLGTTNGMAQFEGAEGYAEHSSSVQAVLNIDGIVSFVHPEAAGENVMAGEWLGGSREENPKNWTEASPLEYANAQTPPFLFVNCSVPRFHAGRDDLLRILNQAGTYHAVHTIPDSMHSFWTVHPWFELTLDYSTAFLRAVFK
ncbi:MAG: family 43 glycosylhydrolase [Lewinellaceae bacterium]|nr:family 43 glycosylhydrolase [Lewinellaceae bacterium]